MEKMDGMTMNIEQANVEKLKEVFPEVFADGKVDFDKLQRLLGNYIANDKERYSFSWKGKADSLRLAQKRSTGTLRPCKEESKNWDTTENLYIEGDNLEVLKLLQRSYFGRIKMIYIDPPYNTGGDFVYSDNYSDTISNYLQITQQLSGDGSKLSSNTESDGRFHTNWLNMIYPRIKLARNLLSDEGSIFISIDDNELDNLIKICNEIFGESNKIACVVWKRKRGRDNSAKWFSKSHEYLLVYAKNKEYFVTNYLDLDEETKQAYRNPDNDPRGPYRMLGTWARGTQGGVEYDFTDKNGQYFSSRLWLMSKDKLTQLDLEDKLIVRGDNIYRKMFIFENKGKIPETLWDHTSNAANASDEIKKLFGEIEGVTDRDYYTNSFHIPVYYPISAYKKIELEGPYHELTNGGHISYIEMDGDPTKNIAAFEKIVRAMHDNGIGYGAINHPVDRDPVCGYNGIIDDVCPLCGRSEKEHHGFERIRRITGYLVGSLDRFMAYLLEETKGVLPLWLNPIQVNIIPVNNEYHLDYANKVNNLLIDNNIRTNLDDRDEKVGYKLREGVMKKILYTLVLGDNEKANNTITYRKYGTEDKVTISLDEFIKMIKDEIQSKK